MCAIRPVIVFNVITLPCTLLSSSHNSIHDLICDTLFCSSKYLENILASFISILFNTSSFTITLPLSVLSLGFHPFSIRRSAICFLLPILKGIYLTLVLSCTSAGGNISVASLDKLLASSSKDALSVVAFLKSKVNPFSSCLSIITLTFFSSSIDSLENLLFSLSNSFITL